MTDSPPPPPLVIQCPSCRQLTNSYCTINERVAVCPPCTEKLRLDLTVLDGNKLVRGVGYALAFAFGACLGVNLLLVALGPTHGATGFIQALCAIFMGIAVGRAARRGSVAGGLPLQLAAIAIAIVAVLEINAGSEYVFLTKQQGLNPAFALVGSLIASPIDVVLAIPGGPEQKARPMILVWLLLAIYNPWRAAAPVALRITGPTPVKMPEASAAPAGEAPDARAAGMDFERPH